MRETWVRSLGGISKKVTWIVVKFDSAFKWDFWSPLSVVLFDVSLINIFFLKVHYCLKMLIIYILLYAVHCSGHFERYHTTIRQDFCLHSFILTHESIMWDIVDISPSTTFSRLQVKPLSRPEIYVSPTGGPPFPALMTSDQHWQADIHHQILEGSLRIHSAEVRQ